MRVVIDHVAGSRRGQRQEFPAPEAPEGSGKDPARIRFGRHPECEVSFDPHRDIDASSRHAELRSVDASWVLVDLGSSNGTFAEGHRVTETQIHRNTPVNIEFGPGGPRVRLFVGDDAEVEALAPVVLEAKQPPWVIPTVGGALVGLVVVILLVSRC